MDALDGVAVRASGDEDDRNVGYLSEPSSGPDPVAATLEINVHQDDIGLIAHCKQKSFLGVCR
jgi:hypothetical protein